MSLVSFGQPDDGIIQMAYVVTDIQAAMELWISKLKVGPWFLLPSFTGVDPQYRGRPSQADVSLAMSFAGHMNVELIQPNNDAPSVYREVLEAGVPAFITGVLRRRISSGMWSAIARPDTTWPSSRAFQAAGALPTWTPRHSCTASWN